MLNETQSILYHWTTQEHLLKIAKTGVLQSNDREKEINNNYSNSDYNICFTRSRSMREGVAVRLSGRPNLALLSIDSTYLNSKIKPFDWYSVAFHGGDSRTEGFRNGRGVQSSRELPPSMRNDKPNFLNQKEERMFPIERNVDISRALQTVEIILNWKAPYTDSDGTNGINDMLNKFGEDVQSAGVDQTLKARAYYTLLSNTIELVKQANAYYKTAGMIQETFGVPVIAYRNEADFERRKPCDGITAYNDINSLYKYVKSIRGDYMEPDYQEGQYSVQQNYLQNLDREAGNYM